jgi:hypothetical protein
VQLEAACSFEMQEQAIITGMSVKEHAEVRSLLGFSLLHLWFTIAHCVK